MAVFVLQEVVESDNKKLVHFLKLHATWPVMCHYAEELSMRAPLQVRIQYLRPLTTTATFSH